MEVSSWEIITNRVFSSHDRDTFPKKFLERWQEPDVASPSEPITSRALRADSTAGAPEMLQNLPVLDVGYFTIQTIPMFDILGYQ